MRICLGHIDCKVHGVLDAVVPIACQPHQISPARLAFGHVADGFFQQVLLCQHTDDKRVIFHQADCAVFQLSGGIGFRMNIGDLLHFEAALQADGIVHASPYEENVSCIGEFCRKPLDAFFVFQHPADFIRKGQKLLDIVLIFRRCYFPPDK